MGCVISIDSDSVLVGRALDAGSVPVGAKGRDSSADIKLVVKEAGGKETVNQAKQKNRSIAGDIFNGLSEMDNTSYIKEVVP
jgi:hypothetical protein